MEDVGMIKDEKQPDFSWAGKRVLVTGHSGFKGGWLTIWLNHLGAHVTGISLPPESNPNLFALAGIDELCDSHYCDIRDSIATAKIIRQARPEILFHLAAQPLVRPSYRKPLETFSTNIMGTAHTLDALRDLDSIRVAVMITTDKVYKNEEWPWPYRENDSLGGYDPYSASKAACEIIIDCYRQSFLEKQGIALASCRAGNVIGGGDWAEDRLIPDAVRAWQTDQPLEIRNPDAVRPWQHVLEPLAGYLIMAERLWNNPAQAGAYNLGPDPDDVACVGDVTRRARQAFGSGNTRFDEQHAGPHETSWLTLDASKAKNHLGIRPRWSLDCAIDRTMNWYKALQEGKSARELCLADIQAYEASQ